jgi:hypothetical protein
VRRASHVQFPPSAVQFSTSLWFDQPAVAGLSHASFVRPAAPSIASRWLAGDGLIRTPLKELASQLDAAHFVQVHRSVVVNLRAISHVTRGPNETADIHLKGRPEVLPVSRSYLHLFRQM